MMRECDGHAAVALFASAAARAVGKIRVNLESASLCDRDDLRTRIGQRLAVPVSELLRDC